MDRNDLVCIILILWWVKYFFEVIPDDTGPLSGIFPEIGGVMDLVPWLLLCFASFAFVSWVGVHFAGL